MCVKCRTLSTQMQQLLLSTSFGHFYLQATAKGLRRLSLVPEPEVATLKDCPTETENPHLRAAARQLVCYFASQKKEFELELDFGEVPDFHRRVWEALLDIPYGRTVSYQYIAERLGDKNAIRAVGQANRRNPIAIVVPCHRVIAKNGDLQGYFYGLDFKRRLLALENPRSFAEQGALF